MFPAYWETRSRALKLAAPSVRIRCYSDLATYEVIVALRGKEMCLWCRDYDQAVKWARVECRSYGVTEVTVERVRGQTVEVYEGVVKPHHELG
jgi:hypothetical protein